MIHCGEPPAAKSPRLVISLDGQWDFATDPKNEGEAQKWYLPENKLPAMPLPGYAPSADGRIVVPGIWDAQGYGTETAKLRHNFVGKGWYRRQATAPQAEGGRRVFLRITGVHRYAKVWADDRYLGEHIGYLSAFEYDITDRAAGKPLTITIQVDSRQRWDVDGLFGAGDLADYFDAEWGGIWGHVSIEVRPETWLDDLFVQPKATPARCAVSAAVRGKPLQAGSLRLEILDGDGKHIAQEAKPLPGPLQEGASVELAAAAPQAALWTTDTPSLYLARLSLLDGQNVLDTIESRFGFREIEIRGPYFQLNGKRLFLRGYGDDHIYPKEMARPADKKVYLDRLRLIKSFGFDFVRHHSTIMPPEYYEACDELGMLVSAEFPIAYENFYRKAGKEALETHKREWEAVLRQFRNHPSVFDWCMGNEFWDGLPLAPEFAALARRLDPTRPFVDSDGLWRRFLGRDRDTLDFYFLMFDVSKIPLDIPGKFLTDKPRKPVVSHETGNYVTFPRLDQFDLFTDNVKPFWTAQGIAKLKALGLAGEAANWSEKSERLYLFCHKNNLEALRRNPYISGHQWWLFQDYWTTSNGIVDFLYRPKAIRPEEVRRMVNDVVLLADGLERTSRGKSSLMVELVVSNYSPTVLAGAAINWRAKLEGKELQNGQISPVAVGQGEVAAVGKLQLTLPDVPQASCLLLETELVADGRRFANDWTAWVFPAQMPRPPAPVPVYAGGDLMGLLEPCGAKPIPAGETLDAKAVYAVRQLDSRLVDAAAQGACIVLIGNRRLAPTVLATFKTSWWKSENTNDNNCGTVVYDHPVTRALAPDGWCDAGWYSLLQGAFRYNLEALPQRPDVIIRGIPHLHLMADHAFLFEARVGKGSLLVSGLNHEAAKDRPEGQWLLARMIEHAATLPKPRSELPEAFLRARLPPPPPKGPFLQGFARLLQKGEEGVWHSYREDNIACYVCRQTAVGNAVEWETAAVPADWKAPEATFIFSGGLGWKSQPKTQGFVFLVNGQEMLRFDLVDQVTTWSSADNKVKLQFWPMREIPEDQLGCFYVTLPQDLLRLGQPCRLSVRSLGKDSRRWFSIHGYTDVK
ncbi:MAG: hypothetical protein NTW87_17610 [Planctomycetota bacterium]|nr:hypothetical protein [Planctomycetota bacterium]